MALDLVHTTTPRRRPVDRPAGMAALAVIVFAAGLAFGAVLGVNVAPAATRASVNAPAFDPDTRWFRDYRDGEIGLDSSFRAMSEHRRGEIGADAQ